MRGSRVTNQLCLLVLLTLFLSVVCNAELRTWTAVNGKEVEAEFVSNNDGQVSLKMKTGKTFKVPINKLSKADQNFLKAKSSSAKPVPAEPPSEKPSDTPKSLSEADVERLIEVSIDIESLEERNDLMYQVNESEPYSGWGKLMYDSGQVKRLIPYKDGREEGLWTLWHENGQKASELTTKDDVQFAKKYWNNKGEPVGSLKESRE